MTGADGLIYAGTMKTKEWTPLEPGVLDGKFYVTGHR